MCNSAQHSSTGLGRRGFLRAAAGTAATAGALGAGVSLAPQASAGGRGHNRVPLDQISIQLFTLRELLGADLEGTLASLHDIGYRKVEHAGFVGRSAAQFRAALDDAGLRSTSGHSGIPQPFDAAAWGRTLADAQVVGQQFIVHPFGLNTERTRVGWQRFAADLNRAGAQARAAGLRFGYHNHQFEFLPLLDGGGRRPYDVLLEETDPRLVHLEIDLFWAWRGTNDPVDLFRLARRHPIRQFHVKDMDINASFTDPGTGLINFGRIFDVAPDGESIEYIVEHDSTGQRALTTALVGYNFLRDVRF